ncbi:recombinase family protein [Anaerovorax sp. IOR16]|uniref:recombinase family protein n=1 Tax=Anaerovorax sp. IOR16 TaxID=2773458 RepID=UPI0019D27AA9|nr:recombinase family protein [Anaerovorax sp. IOR16]
MRKIYGYMRNGANESKKTKDQTIRKLNEMGVDSQNIFIENPRGNNKKSELERLFAEIKSGDTLICTDMLQIAKSTRQFSDLVEFAKEQKLKLIVGDFVLDCSKEIDSFTEGMLKMADVFKEIEHNMISQRVKSGLAKAKDKGKMIGRPSLKLENIPKKVIENYDLLEKGAINKTDYAKICYISRPTLDKYLALMRSSKYLNQERDEDEKKK